MDNWETRIDLSSAFAKGNLFGSDIKETLQLRELPN
jgi:hypothetical protein